MRLLHTADLHLGKMLEGHSRYQEQCLMLQEICGIADSYQVDLVLLAGDIFDVYNPSAEAERLFFNFLKDLASDAKRAVVVIAGNHDQPARLMAAAPLALPQGIYLIGNPGELPLPDGQKEEGRVQLLSANTHCLRFSLPRSSHDTVIMAMPYLSQARLQELFSADIADEKQQAQDYEQRLASLFAEGAQAFSPETVNIMMAHLTLAGGKTSDSERPTAGGVMQVGGSFGVGAHILPSNAQYVALGHLHRPQEINAPMPCLYAGSPLAYSFSEAGQSKSLVIADILPGEAAKIERIPLQSGYPLVQWQAKDYEEALVWCEDERNQHMWVDLHIRAPQPLTLSQIQALRKAHSHLVNIQVVLPDMEAESLEAQELAQLDIADKFRLFASRSQGAAVSEDLVELFLDLLASGEEEQDDEDREKIGEVAK